MSDRVPAFEARNDEELAARLRKYRHLVDPVAAADAPLPPAHWLALDEAAARDRALGCLLGLAVGDAVGTTVEFKPRGSFPPVTDMVGGGPFNLAPGEWTDDTTMALCLGESLVANGYLDQLDFMTRLQGWLERGENTVPGRCFDIGTTTRTAIESFKADGEPAAGPVDAASAGNGSLVRLAPLAIFSAGEREEAGLLANKQSRATHGTIECLDACELFMAQLIDALTGADKDQATRPRFMPLSPNLLFINAGEWRTKSRDEIRSSGYVVHTLEAALWSVWQTDNFRDAVLTATNLGDDSDSVAAVAGQLAGALYGASSIPPEWLARLAWRDKITALANDLFDLGSAAP
ncbi:MAG TPA: ADP-ribosylglycohydrolase family protein [Aliidongia sp.]|nr:ADP-ribosylglycohydrolase family protein [Aliidongia sp.]